MDSSHLVLPMFLLLLAGRTKYAPSIPLSKAISNELPLNGSHRLACCCKITECRNVD